MNRSERRAAWDTHRFSPDRESTIEALGAFTSEKLSVAIFAATTWRPITPFLRGELSVEACDLHLTVREYEAASAEIASGADRFDAIILAMDDPEGYGSLFDASVDFQEEDREQLLATILTRVDLLRERTSQLLVLLPPPAPMTPVGLPSLVERRERFVLALRKELESRTGVETIDAPIDPDHHDERLWQLGRIRYAEPGFAALAATIAPRLLARTGRGIKAVIVDLDDTLWGGVLGEKGSQGIEVGEGYPARCYREFQQLLAGWRRRGLLLAVASKNDLEPVREALDGHPEMQIRSSDVDHFEVHWQPKSGSVERILETFNIGAESVLFIDDNPRERSEVAARFPEIAILDFPEDPLELCDRLRTLPWPLFTATSAEDSRRQELQQQQVARRGAQETAANREEYLQSLGIEVEVSVDRAEDVVRVAQLHQKTNQFNMDPVRHGEAEIQSFLEHPDHRVLSLRFRDRFGDAGLVGAATVELADAVVSVRTLVLSCRVIGLGAEHCLLAAIQALEPTTPLAVSFRSTERNAPARNFLQSLETVEDPSEPGRYWIQMPVTTPAWIQSNLKDSEHA